MIGNDEQLEDISVRIVSYIVIDDVSLTHFVPIWYWNGLLSNMRMIAFVNDVFDIKWHGSLNLNKTLFVSLSISMICPVWWYCGHGLWLERYSWIESLFVVAIQCVVIEYGLKVVVLYLMGIDIYEYEYSAEDNLWWKWFIVCMEKVEVNDLIKGQFGFIADQLLRPSSEHWECTRVW